MAEKGDAHTSLTNSEMAMVQKIADRDGISTDEAATNLVKTALARRVRKKTGRGPARVYSIRGKR